MERGGTSARDALGRQARVLVLVVAAAIALTLLLPAVAGAATFTVNSIGDGSDAAADGVCETAANNAVCTLRAAIEEANAQSGQDTIDFDPAISSCTSAFSPCTIQVLNATAAGELDPIAQAVTIDGCSSDPDHAGPCVELEMQSFTTAANNSRGLTVAGAADDTQIRGLAITHAAIGIDYRDGATGLVVTNDWFGVDLDGTTANSDHRGLFLSGDGATVGGTAGATGTSQATRNVFANASVAAVTMWQDADFNQVLGNYIGTLPDGVTPAPNGDGIHVAAPSASPTEPDDDTIGGDLSSVAPAECDGGCNVIAASGGDGIDLAGSGGEVPAGETTILGNFIGLDAVGDPGASSQLANSVGIRVGNANDVSIGSGFGEERNFVAADASGTAVLHTGGANLKLLYNSIGLNPAGAVVSGPGSTGVRIGGTAIPADGAVLTGNRIAGPSDGIGAVLAGANSTLTGNTFGLASVAGSGGAVALDLAQGAHDNAIGAALGPANVIGSAAGPGIRIDGGDDNTIRRNLVGAGSGGADRGNGGAGIEVVDGPGADPANGNSIGAPLATDAAITENGISYNDGDAIEVTGTGTDDLIGRNHGADNGSDPNDLFIDLGPDGPGNVGGPNGQIRMPVISTATTEGVAGAGGAADPGALVRVFRAATAAPGRVDAFLGETTASAATGSWSLDYSSTPLAPGGILVATQTIGQRSSELSDPVAYADVTPPVLEMSRESPQRVLAQRGVTVFGRCLSEPCPTVIATAKVVLGDRIFRFGAVTRSLGSLRKRFDLPARRTTLEALKVALTRRPYPRALVTMTAQDAAGNLTVARRRVTLNP
jgi:CSLREA domain-containing protein